MTEEGFIAGFANGLLYAQAYNDVEGGKQTLEAHLPNDWFDGKEWQRFENLEAKLTAYIKDLDDGGVTVFRFKDGRWGTRVIEIGSSEGHHGIPEWED